MDEDGQPRVHDCDCGSDFVDTSPAIQGALQLLLEAYDTARRLNHDVWDFAVEISCLREQGVSHSQLRYLSCQGYVEHAREVTKSEDRRRFRPMGRLTLVKRSCFVLTAAGVKLAQSIETVPAHQQNGRPYDRRNFPEWDCDRRELRFQGQVIKRFKLPSANQETILMAFQEEGWPARIHDPLPPTPQCDPKQRLRDSIKSLNRCHKKPLLRFTGDGTGEGILWEPIQDTDNA